MGLFLDLAWSSVLGSVNSNAGLSFPWGATSCPGTARELREGNPLLVVIYVVTKCGTHKWRVHSDCRSPLVRLSETLGAGHTTIWVP